MEALAEAVKHTEAPAPGSAEEVAGYRKMSLDPFTWVDEKGLPQLAMFRLDGRTFTLWAHKPMSFFELLSTTLIIGLFIGQVGGILLAGLLALLPFITFGVAYVWCTSVLTATMFAIFLMVGMFVTERPWMIVPHLPKPLRACYNTFRTRMEQTRKEKEVDTYSVTVRFRGTIPLKTWNKIHIAEQKFKGVFIVAEPRDWDKKEIKTDPLVVGWDGTDLWLVDVFDLSPSEKYAVSEF